MRQERFCPAKRGTIAPNGVSAQLAADDRADDELRRVKGQIGDDAQEQGLHEADGLLVCQPQSAEQIAHDAAQDHADQNEEKPAAAFIHEEAADQGHEDIADDISARGAEQLSRASCEVREHGKACQAQQDVDDDAKCPQLRAQHGADKIDSQKSQGDGDRADGDVQGYGAQNAEDRGHQACQCQLLYI